MVGESPLAVRRGLRRAQSSRSVRAGLEWHGGEGDRSVSANTMEAVQVSPLKGDQILAQGFNQGF